MPVVLLPFVSNLSSSLTRGLSSLSQDEIKSDFVMDKNVYAVVDGAAWNDRSRPAKRTSGGLGFALNVQDAT